MVRFRLSGHRQNLRRGPSSCIHANPRRICLVLFHFTIPPSPRLPVIGTKNRSDLEPSTRHRLLGAFFETSIFGPQGTWCSTKLLAFTSALLAPPFLSFHHSPPITITTPQVPVTAHGCEQIRWLLADHASEVLPGLVSQPEWSPFQSRQCSTLALVLAPA